MTVIFPVLLTLVACSSAGDEPTWSCTDVICFPTPDACGDFVTNAAGTGRCEPRPFAYCSHGCRPSSNDGNYPSCGASCATELEGCQGLEGQFQMVSGRCKKELPQEPFLHDSTPGFWCFQYQAAPDRPHVSWCTKYREECDYLIDDTLAKLGANRETAAHIVGRGCEQATNAYCWTRLVQGAHVPLCTTTAALCFATRAMATPDAPVTSECRLVSPP